MAGPSQEQKPRRRTPWRDNVEALVVAVLMAVFLKYFIVEAYKIPTGSMQPTLMGQAFGQGGGIFDRILVDKLSFHLREPERFEVVVFKYPLDRSKNFVKRLWGLPGEQLSIEFGDVWTRRGELEPKAIARRPRAVQRETWKPLDLGAKDPQSSWKAEDGPWKCADRSIEARGDGRALFVGHGGGPILDRYLDGYPSSLLGKVSPRVQSGANSVGDLRVEGRVRALEGCSSIAVELEEAGRRYRLEIPGPAAEPDARPRVAILTGEGRAVGAGTEARGEPYRLPAGRWVDFGAQNLDDLLELDLEGEVVADLEVAPAAGPGSAAHLLVSGAGADLRSLQVYRDIYYLPSSSQVSWTIPEGHYFMLGDNTQDSSDSREWTFESVCWGESEAESRIVRGNYRPADRGSSPLDANPWRGSSLQGPMTWLRDEWGEKHVFPSAQELPLPPAERRAHAPFVPRDLITGRALLVFWPIAPRLRLWRLRWVH